MRNKAFYSLIIFYIGVLWFASFSKATLPPHFLNHGFGIDQLLLAAFFGYLGIFLGVFLFRPISHILTSRWSWRCAMGFTCVYLLMVIHPQPWWKLYTASLINGLATMLFYTFYNTAHFTLTPKKLTGQSSALMFSLGPIVSIAAPLVAGTIAKNNMQWIWIISIGFFLLLMFYAGKQINFTLNYTIRSSLKEIWETRIFIFLEGIWGALLFGIIPVYTLFFVQTPLGYGTYLSYLAIVASIANLFLGKLTDKLQKRISFLYPVAFGIGLTTLFFPFALNGFRSWIIVTGVIHFLIPLFSNLSTAMVVDTNIDLKLGMVGREIMLNAGRIIGLLIAYAAFKLHTPPSFIFIFLGSVMLMYPFLLAYRAKYSKRYAYL